MIQSIPNVNPHDVKVFDVVTDVKSAFVWSDPDGEVMQEFRNCHQEESQEYQYFYYCVQDGEFRGVCVCVRVCVCACVCQYFYYCVQDGEFRGVCGGMCACVCVRVGMLV